MTWFLRRGGLVVLSGIVLLSGVAMSRCNLGPGLNASDFERVSENGFDEADNEADKNHYAWAMKYFQADNSETGGLYVGTGNNIAGLIGFYFTDIFLGDGDLLDAPVCPPEIRRYRPDLGPTEWETVLDYRDVEPEGSFRTTGFRYMATYEAVVSDDLGAGRATYLYAATQGLESALWRSRTGDYGDWERVFSTGEGGASVRWMAEHNGRFYLALAYDTYEAAPPPGEIWVSDDGLCFEPLVEDGFGNPNNRGMEFVISFNGWLYAGTKNDVEGYEIWKLEGPAGSACKTKVVDHGGPNPRNEIAGTPVVYRGRLYVGSIIFFGFNPAQLNGFKGSDIIRLDEFDHWETVVGPDSMSGYDSGFNHFTNSYLWWMEEHDGWLYASTWDQATILSWGLSDPEGLIDLIGSLFQNKDRLSTLYALTHAGADIFKTPDGVHWFPVTLNGMGNPENYGWRTMESAPDGYLYVGSANPNQGLEVWRASTCD
jgi:hypothetical protein